MVFQVARMKRYAKLSKISQRRNHNDKLREVTSVLFQSGEEIEVAGMETTGKRVDQVILINRRF